jgi:hypothetical protein
MTHRGVDITARHLDISRLAAAYWRQSKRFFKKREGEGRAARRIECEDFVQDVLLTIHRRNDLPSAYDPSRASLSKYVWKICFSVASHGTERLEPEKLTREQDGAVSLLDAPVHDSAETIAAASVSPESARVLAELAAELHAEPASRRRRTPRPTPACQGTVRG